MEARGVLQEQFDLAYHTNGGVDYTATQNMPIAERRVLYDMLITVKKQEAEAYKNAARGKGRGAPSGPDTSQPPPQIRRLKRDDD